MPKKSDMRDYAAFANKIGKQKLDGVDMTHDGHPLSVKEAKFIDLMVVNGDINKCLRESNLQMRSIAGKDYIANEIAHRLDLIKKETIADADEIMQYFTAVMRNQEKDQFGLDAPLSERTNAAKELARRIVDTQNVGEAAPEIKITLNWEGM